MEEQNDNSKITDETCIWSNVRLTQGVKKAG